MIRKSERSFLNLPIKIRTSKNMETWGLLQDLSVSGARFDSQIAINKGGRLDLEIPFLANHAPLKLSGLITWTNQKSMGLRFLNLRKRDQRVIERIVFFGRGNL